MNTFFEEFFSPVFDDEGTHHNPPFVERIVCVVHIFHAYQSNPPALAKTGNIDRSRHHNWHFETFLQNIRQLFFT